MSSPIRRIAAVRILLPFCLGYMLSYFSRNVSAILANDFSQEFAISANALGLLTSAYFLAFALCQIPLGLLLDRFAPSRVEAAFLSVATIGALLSAIAPDAFILSLGRIMIGFGVSACLMASYRTIIQWFPTEKIPLLNSIVLIFGGLGAISSGWPPTTDFVTAFGWRNIFFLLTICFAGCILLLLFVVPLPKRSHSGATPGKLPAPLITGLLHVLCSQSFWIIVPATALAQGMVLAINGLWVVPWLMRVEGLSLEKTSLMLMFISVSMLIGQLLAGTMGSQLGGRYQALWKLLLIGIIVPIGAILLISIRTGIPALPLWIIFTLFSPFSMLAYPMLVQKFPNELAGRVITLINFWVFFCAFLVQWLIGAIIGAIPANSDDIDVLRFQIAFALPSLLCLPALLWMIRADILNRTQSQ